MNKLDQSLVPDFTGGEDLRGQVVTAARQEGLSDLERRQAVITILRSALKEGRAAAEAFLMKGSPLGSAKLGIATARGLSRLMDQIVGAAYDFTTQVEFPVHNPTAAEQLAIVSVGGYGRDMLAPGSDVDLLFLLPYKQTAWGEQVVENTLYILWDLGLKVGHATRSVEDCLGQARRDVTIRTTLLEARFLYGDHSLYTKLRRRFWTDVARSSSADFIDAKLAEREARHERTGGSRYSVEPNLKDGKGGLRDLHTLIWIGKFVYRVELTRALVKYGLLTEEEFESFEEAESFLWEVRCHLHFIAGRAEEKLSFDRQLDLAERFGFKDTDEMRGVEHFMKRYFLVAKEVGDLTRLILAALEAQQKKRFPVFGEIFSFASRKTTFEGGFALEMGRLTIADETVFESDPVNLLRLFHISDTEEVLIHPYALKLAARSVGRIDDALRADKEANRLFLEVLTSPRDPERVLRRMNEVGVLGAFIPDFGRVVAMMQFNMYHHFTVDEHLLRAIGNLARIEGGELKDEHPLADSIIRKLKNRRVLYLAVLLHDIAKGRKEDHSEAGATIARTLGPRLGFSASETDTVAWLVEQHLVMSMTAQSRDPTDPRTIEEFTSLVQSPERLKLLLILTVADIRAVGPGVWNGWKGELLRTLYYQAEPVLLGGHSSEPSTARIEARQAELSEQLVEWPEEARDTAIRRMPPNYWLGVDSRLHARHTAMIRDAEEAGLTFAFSFEPDEFRAVTALTIYAEDSPGLFAQIAGAISSTAISIQDAKAFTLNDGRVLDIFWLQTSMGGPLTEPDQITRIKERVAAVATGGFDPNWVVGEERLARRQKAFSIEPEVIVDNQASELLTVIEINARDRRGLLYDLANTLWEERLRISSAHVATFGERVVDVFYVKDGFGLKAVHPHRVEHLKARLIEAIAGETAAAAE